MTPILFDLTNYSLIKRRFCHIFHTIYKLLIAFFVLSAQVNAGEFIQWQSSNVQLLRGWDYQVTEDQATIVTVEYANQWRYGDFFMFIDGTRFDSGDKKAYSEISPRFSFSKMTGESIAYGAVKDISVSSTIEVGESGSRIYLLGIGLDFHLEGFTFFNVNMYQRHNPDLDDSTWQLTTVWKYPFTIGKISFITEGFADLAGDAGNVYHNNQYIVPRLLADIGSQIGVKPKTLWLGIEYSYWNNKYGISGVTETAPQLQMKWVF